MGTSNKSVLYKIMKMGENEISTSDLKIGSSQNAVDGNTGSHDGISWKNIIYRNFNHGGNPQWHTVSPSIPGINPISVKFV